MAIPCLVASCISLSPVAFNDLPDDYLIHFQTEMVEFDKKILDDGLEIVLKVIKKNGFYTAWITRRDDEVEFSNIITLDWETARMFWPFLDGHQRRYIQIDPFSVSSLTSLLLS
jgi:hypothetical protein